MVCDDDEINIGNAVFVRYLKKRQQPNDDLRPKFVQLAFFRKERHFGCFGERLSGRAKAFSALPSRNRTSLKSGKLK